MKELLKIISSRKSDLLVAIVVLVVSALLITPIPTFLLDILLAVNIATSLFLLLVGLYLPNPLSLLSFPTILLLTTLFRLGLNVASARLILSKGEAGKVIEAFGTLLVQGEVVVGIIIFTILTVVNFVVISKGTSRVSEVAARFALDSLPGKQMAIDADLRANIITPEQARIQRNELRKESQLFGSMDGAMKFVQGDAIAGIFIIFVNIIGGMYVGLKNGLGFGDAVETYTKLTVGDGLVTQIPALLISICAGIVVTRVSAKDASTFGKDIAEQLFARTYTLYATGAILVVIGLIPGLPAFPFLLSGGAFFGLAYYLTSTQPFSQNRFSRFSTLTTDISDKLDMRDQGNRLALAYSASTKSENDAGEDNIIIYMDQKNLYRNYRSRATKSKEWWNSFRDIFYENSGLNLPNLYVQPVADLITNEYRVYYKGITIDTGILNPEIIAVESHPENASIFGLTLVLEGEHPIHKNRIFWTNDSESNRRVLNSAEIRNYDYFEFITLKISEYFRHYPETLVSLTDTYLKVKDLEKKFPGVVEDIMAKNALDISRLTEILLALARDKVSIRDFKEVIELIALYCSTLRSESNSDEIKIDIRKLVDFIRVQKRRFLVQNFITNDKTIKAFMIEGNEPMSGDFLDEYTDFQHKALRQAVVLCEDENRNAFSANFARKGYTLPVFSYAELDPLFNIERI